MTKHGLLNTFPSFPLRLHVQQVVTSTLTFKVKSSDCTIDGVRANYNLIFNPNQGNPEIGSANSGYLASVNFPGIAQH